MTEADKVRFESIVGLLESRNNEGLPFAGGVVMCDELRELLAQRDTLVAAGKLANVQLRGEGVRCVQLESAIARVEAMP